MHADRHKIAEAQRIVVAGDEIDELRTEVHVIRPPRLRAGCARRRRGAGRAGAARRVRRRCRDPRRPLPLVHDERIFARDGLPRRRRRRARRRAARGAGRSDRRRGGVRARRLRADAHPRPRSTRAAFARAPKLIVGFSDVTALHAWACARRRRLAARAGRHAARQAARRRRRGAVRACESPTPPPPLTGLRALGRGRRRRRRRAGSSAATSRWSRASSARPWALPLDGAVLLARGGRRAPLSHRPPAHAARASPARSTGLAGVVVGDFVGCAEKDGSAARRRGGPRRAARRPRASPSSPARRSATARATAPCRTAPACASTPPPARVDVPRSRRYVALRSARSASVNDRIVAQLDDAEALLVALDVLLQRRPAAAWCGAATR